MDGRSSRLRFSLPRVPQPSMAPTAPVFTTPEVESTDRRSAMETARQRKESRAHCQPLARLSSGHSIGLTLASIKAISSELSPYLAYNCRSISGIGFDQSMSDAEVKSCSGTCVHLI